MRKKPGQSYVDWIDQIKSEELKRASKELARGANPEQVMDVFAERFFQKAMHPLIKMVEAEFKVQYLNENQKNGS